MRRAVLVLVGAGLLGASVIGLFFLQQDPQELEAWWASPAEQPRPPPPSPPPSPAPSAPPAPRPSPPPELPRRPAAECLAMTWGVRASVGLGTWVGAIDNSTNAYRGDTPCSETRPLLCFKPGNAPAPKGLELPAPIRWSGGEIALVPDVLGLELRSRELGDRMCGGKYGEGWRMAEFHDAGAWGYGALGELPRDARFWVAINDQPANPWN